MTKQERAEVIELIQQIILDAEVIDCEICTDPACYCIQNKARKCLKILKKD